jgi:ATP-dependent Clp protease adapter protein ClpS
MFLRHAQTLIKSAEHDHLVTPMALVTVLLAAYFSIPEWYMTQVVNVIHDHGVRLLIVPSMVWKYVKVHAVVPKTILPGHSTIRGHLCGHHGR